MFSGKENGKETDSINLSSCSKYNISSPRLEYLKIILYLQMFQNKNNYVLSRAAIKVNNILERKRKRERE